jgi:hypothetical protein
MSLLELLRKSGFDGDVDFLKEALNVLVHSVPADRPRVHVEHPGQLVDGQQVRHRSTSIDALSFWLHIITLSTFCRRLNVT